MIDEERTLELFGYTSDQWGQYSRKLVVAVCDVCGTYRVRAKHGCGNMCKSCFASSENHPNAKPKIIIICQQCGKSFKVKPSKKDSRFCCMECKGKSQSNSQLGGNNPIWKAKITIICEQCGTSFEVPPCRADDRFCSRGCTANWHSGKNHPRWKGGATPWRKWIMETPQYRIWRRAVFERDNYTCQKCAVRGGDIQAHHIHPVRDNINTLRIFDVDNGITLCTECHRETFGNEYDYIDEFENIVENGGV